MKRILPLAMLVLVLGSCTSAYKSGQTPDDVYFSPGREESGYIATQNNRDGRRYYEEENLSDRYLRMKAINRSRWSAFDDDFMYWNNPVWNNPFYYSTMRPFYPVMTPGWNFNVNYFGGYNPWFNSWNSPWASPYFGSSWHNPFRHPGFYGTPVVVVTNPRAYTPRRSGSLSGYSPTRSYMTDPKTGVRTYNISGARNFSGRTSSGGYYTPSSGRSSGSYNSDSYNSTPSRSFNSGSNNSAPSRSSGSGSSGGSRGGGGGSAPVRSFPRGG